MNGGLSRFILCVSIMVTVCRIHGTTAEWLLVPTKTLASHGQSRGIRHSTKLLLPPEGNSWLVLLVFTVADVAVPPDGTTSTLGNGLCRHHSVNQLLHRQYHHTSTTKIQVSLENRHHQRQVPSNKANGDSQAHTTSTRHAATPGMPCTTIRHTQPSHNHTRHPTRRS